MISRRNEHNSSKVKIGGIENRGDFHDGEIQWFEPLNPKLKHQPNQAEQKDHYQ